MKLGIVGLIALLAVCSAVDCRRRKTYDYKDALQPTSDMVTSYVLAKSWQGSVCQYKDCSQYGDLLPNTWNLHGLWPNSTEANMFNCDPDMTFDINKMDKNVRAYASRHWSGLWSSQASFWAHEFTKHGTCWHYSNGVVEKMPAGLQPMINRFRRENIPLLDAYFQFSAFLSGFYSFYNVLEKAGFPPKDTPYTTAAFAEALNQGFGGKDLFIMCQTKKGVTYVNEVRICLDTNYNPISCAPETNCGPSLVYHTI